MALKRELGLGGVFAMATGAMISSGLFVLPTIVYGLVGPAFVLSYLIATLALLPSVMCKAELMTAMPKAGGTYYHVDRSFGPVVGMVSGTANWAALAAKSAFALLGIGAFAVFLAEEFNLLQGGYAEGWVIKGVAVLFCAVFAMINVLGTKHAGRLQVFLVAGLLTALGGYMVWGGLSAEASSFRRSFFPEGVPAVFVGAAMVFMAYGGITQIANLAEDVRHPKRDLVRGMFLAYVVVSLVYVVACLVTVGLLPHDAAEWSWAPFSQAARVFSGTFGWAVMGLAAMAAYMTTGNAGILTASRSLMAMSQDELVPQSLSRVSRRFHTPVNAILLTSGFMALGIVALPLELFVKAGSAMIILLLIFECLSVILMRESRIPTYQPTWRSPGYPWLQGGGVVVYAFFLVELGSLPLLIAGGVLGAALAWYGFRSEVQVVRESALVRVAERFARMDFDDHDLEAELSAIVRERDDVRRDPFDRLVEQCPVLDLPGQPSRDEVLRAVAAELHSVAGMDQETLADLLRKREELSSTVLRPGVAVPHLVRQDVEEFGLALVRVKEGADFAGEGGPVYTIFAVVVPPKEQEFYLRVLVAISETVQTPDFDERWQEARSAEGLREVVLRSDRPRE
ncbi:MAG: amino acid permease [Candidatus Brocadiia bacterium]